ncbi:zinc finger protein 892-like [Betta splendens]|uniref:Zinc finger protein 892-like n=1 Tax=Betta splendens TaxID=158456 RepID=A0A9W2XDU2_BETSP|nr:zinc finger protein 892-like [Betta splendens]
MVVFSQIEAGFYQVKEQKRRRNTTIKDALAPWSYRFGFVLDEQLAAVSSFERLRACVTSDEHVAPVDGAHTSHNAPVSVQRLRAFVTERLTAAAAEILGAFEKTMEEYEAEIGRQRRLLDVVWRPEVRLHRLGEFSPQHVCKEEEALIDLQLWNQDVEPGVDPLEPELPQNKDLEELHSGQKGEQLVLKQETDDVTIIPSSEESEPTSELLSNSSPTSDTNSKSHTDKKTFNCVICGKSFKYNSIFQRHLRTHTGEKPHVCDTCGKGFSESSYLKAHLKVHTAEGTFKYVNAHTDQKPLPCHTCGKRFTYLSQLKIHSRIHTGEKPYCCQTCKRAFSTKSVLTIHMRRAHTGERPYPCTSCGKRFPGYADLINHNRVHTGERPYTCETCGKTFRQGSTLHNHLKTHTGEKPYICSICGKRFLQVGNMRNHMKTHK